MSDPLPLLHELAPLLVTDRFGRTVQGYRTTDSTNTRAAHWAAQGAPEGSLVFAEHQTQGRGRFKRAWTSGAGLNLTFTLVLRPVLAAEQFGLITLAAGVAVAEAVDAFVRPLESTIKWPNDVLLHNLKTCGILLETNTRVGAIRPAVFLGIGLNVNQIDFPEPIAATATSMRLAYGQVIPRAPVLAQLLTCFEAAYDTLTQDDGETVRRAYLARMAGLHAPATLLVTEPGTSIRGIVRGIDINGALRLQIGDTFRTFHAGETTLKA